MHSQKQSGRRKSAAAPDRRRTSLSKAQQPAAQLAELGDLADWVSLGERLDCGEGSRAHSTRQGRFYGGTQQGLEREVRRNCSRG